MYCFGQFEHANRPASPAYKYGILLPHRNKQKGASFLRCVPTYLVYYYIYTDLGINTQLVLIVRESSKEKKRKNKEEIEEDDNGGSGCRASGGVHSSACEGHGAPLTSTTPYKWLPLSCFIIFFYYYSSSSSSTRLLFFYSLLLV